MNHVPDWLARRAALSPEKTALIDTLDGDRLITYRAWNQQANQTANFLKGRLKVRKGDRVAVLAKNCVAYLDIWFALNKIGGVLQNLNWRLAPVELAGLLRDAEPVCLVFSADFHETVLEIKHLLGDQLPELVSLDSQSGVDAVQFTERESCSHNPLPNPGLNPEDPWVICYTGGTTGLPKGALLSYRAITANAVNTIISWGLSPEDVTLLNAPLFHTGGLNVFTAPLVYLGGTNIVAREFDLDQTFNLLQSGAVTVWFGVPTMFVMMQNDPRWEQADFSRNRFLISGGAPCPLPVFEKFWAKGVDFKTGYGLTEAGPNTFWLPAEQVQAKPGAVGYPLFHVEVQVVGEDGQERPPGEVGELLIRGPHLFSGYWRSPEATAEALQGGWLHTGDLAVRDADGAYTIMGRSKDMIISGGENIYPSEIESVLHAPYPTRNGARWAGRWLSSNRGQPRTRKPCSLSAAPGWHATKFRGKSSTLQNCQKPGRTKWTKNTWFHALEGTDQCLCLKPMEFKSTTRSRGKGSHSS
jgi:fatty-acyl-CoA synthase